MKKTLGNLALVGGVIVSSLAAGESQRVSRAAGVDGELVGAVLHTPVSSHFEEEQPEALVVQDRTLEAGRVLSAADVEWLRSLGQEEVLVRRRAQTARVVAVDQDAIGGVLSEAMVLPKEFEEIRPGRLITAGFAARLEASELSQVAINTEVARADGSKHREELLWPLAPGAEPPPGVSLVGSNLRETISLPVQLRESSYVDARILERLRASEIGEISIKIPRTWTWQGWASRWIFVIGIAITIGGVLLKRARPDVEELEAGALQVAHLGQLLSELEGAVERLTGRVEKMDAEAIHHAVDPLLIGPVYEIAEGRESIRGAHGGRVYASVMDAFARGERKLNRAWSAAVDGHAPEARTSLVAALPALREAREALPGTRAPGPRGFEDNDPALPLPPDVPLAGASDPWGDDS
jgi:hypothetical protein